MAVHLMTEPSGARLPTGKQTVAVNPRTRARSGDMIASSGSMPSICLSLLRKARAARAVAPPVEAGVERVAETVVTLVSKSGSAQLEHDLGDAASEKYLHGGKSRGPLGSASTRRGTWRLTSPSLRRRPLQSRGVCDGGNMEQ